MRARAAAYKNYGDAAVMSLILDALKYDGMEMPPAGKLPESVIQDFEKWIKTGATVPNGNWKLEIEK